MGSVNKWPCVRLLMSPVDVSPPEDLPSTLSRECNDTGSTLFTMPTKPEGLPSSKVAAGRNDVNLRFPRFYVLRRRAESFKEIPNLRSFTHLLHPSDELLTISPIWLWASGNLFFTPETQRILLPPIPLDLGRCPETIP